MLGYQPISSLPISDIDLGAVATKAQLNGKIFSWTIPFQSTTWNLSSTKREWIAPSRDDKTPSTWTVGG